MTDDIIGPNNEYELNFNNCVRMRTRLAMFLNKTRHVSPEYKMIQMVLVDEMTKFCVCASELSYKNPSRYGNHTRNDLSILTQKIYAFDKYQSHEPYFSIDKVFLQSCLKRKMS